MNTRVLFVDDEENVLSGLRRMLRGQRKVWDMKFAHGGGAALELMAQEAFDVVVTDMRMPGIDGAELLSQVSQKYPNTVRLVLSGQSEHEKIFRAIGPAHQFLSKPCESDVLIDTIQRSCRLHEQLQATALREVTAKIKSLPSLPSIYGELVQEIKSDDVSLDRVADIISSDVAMTAKVMQLVNSSFFGLPQHIACPKHAVSLLGLNILQPLVLSAGAFSKYEDPGIPGFSLEDSIEHSLAVATASKAIAESESAAGYVVDAAFIGGMMHDVGKLILAVNLTEQFSEACQLAAAENMPLWQAEQRALGTTHAEVGAHLLGLWGLPNPIVEAVTFHHRPSECESQGFSAVTAIHVANVLQNVHFPGDRTNTQLELDQNYLQSLGLADRVEHWEALTHQGAGV